MEHPDFGPLFRFLCLMGVVYAAGIFTSFLIQLPHGAGGPGGPAGHSGPAVFQYARLPIRYFDTHTHGDIMSRYTNDIDTLRQMISQSIPQCISSVVTIVTVFVTMLAHQPGADGGWLW